MQSPHHGAINSWEEQRVNYISFQKQNRIIHVLHNVASESGWFYQGLLFIITEKMQTTSYNFPNCPLCQNTLKKRKEGVKTKETNRNQ